MESIKDLDLYMYAGEWYEIARLPNPWQKNCTYALSKYYVDDSDKRSKRKGKKELPKLDLESDCINKSGEVINTFKGKAYVPNAKNTGALKAKWEMSPKESWMIVYDTDYTNYAFEGDDEKKYLWILSRSPEMCIDLMRGLLLRAKELGFDIENVEIAPETLIDCPVDYYENEDVPRDMSYSPSCNCGGEDDDDEDEDKSYSPSCNCGGEDDDDDDDDTSYAPRHRSRRRRSRR